jgi:predicted O-methyltransferase YrrM
MTDEIIKKIKITALDLSVPIMKDESAEALVSLLKARKPKKILEIGTGVGYSGTLMLAASEDSFLTTIELDCSAAKIAKSFFALADLSRRVRLIEGDATSVIPMTEARFDFIFLDGPKGQYEALRPYLVDLLAVGGVIFADNILFKGYVNGAYNEHKHRTIVNSLRAFRENMKGDGRFKVELSEVGDGILTAERIL